jgi:hypothetical protein
MFDVLHTPLLNRVVSDEIRAGWFALLITGQLFYKLSTGCTYVSKIEY